MTRTPLLLFVFLVACNRNEAPQSGGGATATQPPAATSTMGDVDKGKLLSTQYGCNVCHVMPGVEAPQGMLGPSLAGVASRATISNGAVPNSPENLVKYVINPPSLNPQSAMPALGISEPEARDIAAYLLTLK